MGRMTFPHFQARHKSRPCTHTPRHQEKGSHHAQKLVQLGIESETQHSLQGAISGCSKEYLGKSKVKK